MYKCPYCKECYYEEGITVTTDMYYPPIIKDGININPDKNCRTTYCHCLSCNKDFLISGNDVDGYEIFKSN